MRASLALAAFVTASATVQAQVLIASTSTTNGTAQIVGVDPVSGVVTPFMTVPVPSPYEVANLSAHPPCRLAGNIYRNDNANNRSRLLKINPESRSSEMIEFGAPLNAMYSEGFDWSPRHSAFMISYGPFGNFGTTRLALFDENGTVLATSNALPVADIDIVASTATIDLLMDFNRTTTPRVFQLSALFPNPAVSAYASPPSMTNFHDGAVHPVTGEVIFLDGTGSHLVTLVGNTYVIGAAIQSGYALRGLAWAHLPPLIAVQPSDSGVCPTGAASFAPTGVFDAATFQWQREATPGVYVDLEDGPTSSWDGNAPGYGAVVQGSDSPALTLSAAPGQRFSAAHAINYRVVVSNACGGSASDPSALIICIADFNCSGGTPDDADISAFFDAWNSGEESADVNASGGTPDDADISYFFFRWNAGC